MSKNVLNVLNSSPNFFSSSNLGPNAIFFKNSAKQFFGTFFADFSTCRNFEFSEKFFGTIYGVQKLAFRTEFIDRIFGSEFGTFFDILNALLTLGHQKKKYLPERCAIDHGPEIIFLQTAPNQDSASNSPYVQCKHGAGKFDGK